MPQVKKIVGSMILLIAAIGPCPTECSVEPTEDPVILFDSVLTIAEPDDVAGRAALAHLFTEIPGSSEHEKNIKNILATKFHEKYGISVEDVLAIPVATISIEAPKSNFIPWLISGGMSLLITLGVYGMLYGRNITKPKRSVFTRDKRLVVEAADFIGQG